MEYISSDANIWFDFDAISSLDLPFLLPCKFIMYREALREEIVYPTGLLSELLNRGLIAVEITTEEFYLTEALRIRYRRISVYDAIALSIAKNRDILLITGDNALRQAAINECVDVKGTIGLLDSIYEQHLIDRKRYVACLKQFIKHNERRLPVDELEKRIQKEEDEHEND